MCNYQDIGKDTKITQKWTENESLQNLTHLYAYIVILGCRFQTRYYSHGSCDIIFMESVTFPKRSPKLKKHGKWTKHKNLPKWSRFYIHILLWAPVSAAMFTKFSIFRTMKRLKRAEEICIRTFSIYLFLTGSFFLTPKSTGSHFIKGYNVVWKVSQLIINNLFKILPFLNQICRCQYPTQWLLSGEWGHPIYNSPKLAVG